jgi:cell division protein FtsB
MFGEEYTVNLLTLILIVFASGFIGYSLRSRQIKKKQTKIVELRREMVDNHAHILELEKENVILERQYQSMKTPVRPINSLTNEKEENREVLDSAI